jgi:hypothetical protein
MGVAAVALTHVESRAAERSDAASAFSNHVAACWTGSTAARPIRPRNAEAIFRLRYDAYVREGTIAPDPSEGFFGSVR